MSEMPFTVSIDSAKGVATIELIRPENGNRLTAPEVSELGKPIVPAC